MVFKKHRVDPSPGGVRFDLFDLHQVPPNYRHIRLSSGFAPCLGMELRQFGSHVHNTLHVRKSSRPHRFALR